MRRIYLFGYQLVRDRKDIRFTVILSPGLKKKEREKERKKRKENKYAWSGTKVPILRDWLG